MSALMCSWCYTSPIVTGMSPKHPSWNKQLLNRNFPGETSPFSRVGNVCFRRPIMLYNGIPTVPNCSVTDAATSLHTWLLEQRTFQFLPPVRPAS
jgi:hypothetical protein